MLGLRTGGAGALVVPAWQTDSGRLGARGQMEMPVRLQAAFNRRTKAKGEKKKKKETTITFLSPRDFTTTGFCVCVLPGTVLASNRQERRNECEVFPLEKKFLIDKSTALADCEEISSLIYRPYYLLLF